MSALMKTALKRTTVALSTAGTQPTPLQKQAKGRPRINNSLDPAETGQTDPLEGVQSAASAHLGDWASRSECGCRVAKIKCKYFVFSIQLDHVLHCGLKFSVSNIISAFLFEGRRREPGLRQMRVKSRTATS